MLTESRLKELLRYDPHSGHFYWLVSRRGLVQGTRAGSRNKRGYIEIRIDYELYYAHRLAWLYMTGEWPKDQIDHDNENKSDNSWNNLKESDNSLNHLNVTAYTHNTSGFKGVSWEKRRQQWEAYIQLDNKKIHIGYFSSKLEAADARLIFEAEMP